MEKVLYILESSIIGAADLAQAAKEFDWKPIFLLNISNQEGEALCQIVKNTYIVCDTLDENDVISIIQRLSRKYKPIGIITLLDSRLSIVSNVAKKLNLPGIDSEVSKLTNKNYVYSLIPKSTPQTMALYKTQVDVVAINNFINECKNAIFCKPNIAAGAKGAFFANTVEKILAEIAHYQSSLPKHIDTSCYLLQEYLSGQLVSFEGYVINKRIEFITVTGRLKIGNTETVDLIPFHKQLDQSIILYCQQIIKELVELSGFQLGFFHAEFIVNRNQAKLIDANMGRLGGGNITQVIADCFNINPLDYYKNYLQIAILKKELIDPLLWKKPKFYSFGISYGVKSSCRLLDIMVPDSLVNSHILAVNRGNEIEQIGKNNWSILATIYGHESSLLDEVNKINIITDKGNFSPVYTTDYKLLKSHIANNLT